MEIRNVLCRLAEERRNRYRQQNRKRLTNTAPSIICNNCIGGIIYKDLNLRFCSPTVDVLIQAEDFFRFVNDLEYYITCIPEEIFPEGSACPVGVLRNGEETVVLRFLHETSFETAKDKWVRRCARVDRSNLYIVFNPYGACLRPGSRWYREFKKLKYPKRMIVRMMLFFDKEVAACPGAALFGRKKTLINYPTRFSKKRFLDHFDYVSFLNENHS